MYAVSLTFFCEPNHFVFGGTTGLSIVLATLFPGSDVGTFMWLTNAVLVVLGCVFLGFRRMGWTIYSSFALSAFVSVFERFWPMAQPMTNDTMLEFCFAVLIPAFASGIVFNIGASTGGTEIIAMILSKYTSLEIGRSILVSDIAIALAAAVIYGPGTGLYCILGLVAKSTVVDTAIENLNLRKVCTIISSDPHAVKEFILNELHRSATEQPANGAYTHEAKTVIMTVLTRRQAAHLRDFLRIADPNAFLTIVNSSEIIGRGFQSI